MPRGNQGWSTRGKDGSKGAGRPPAPRGPRQRHTISAYKEEYALLQRFMKYVRRDPEAAERLLAFLEFSSAIHGNKQA